MITLNKASSLVVASAAVAMAAIAGAGVAQADGYQGRGAPVAAPWNWSGLYFGVHSGWAWSETSAVYPSTIIPGASIGGVPNQGWDTTTDAPIVGGQIGLQHQFGQLVVGIEGGLSSTYQTKVGSDLCPKVTIALFNCNARLENVLTLGGRLGLSMGKWMPYVTGGYASARFEESLTNRSLAPIGVEIIRWGNSRDNGWYIGGGVDLAMAHGWTIGLDYKHFEFDSNDKQASAIVGGIWGPLPNDNARFESNADILSLRVSWKLGRVETVAPLK
jgi:outer membrane immunogenic protein